MNTKDLLVKFFKNLGLGLAATLVSFTVVSFSLLNLLGDKAVYQSGTAGQVAAATIISWALVSTLAMGPLALLSLVLSIIQLRKKQ